MTILIAYASRYGATRRIAERVAEVLRAAGHAAEARPVTGIDDLTGHDAIVLGSAVYYGSWLKEATAFARRNQAILATRPVWLFSSGPIGARATDDQGRDVRAAAEPKEIAEFRDAFAPRDHRVFLGKLERRALGLLDRLVASLPAFPGSEGDFRDWPEIDAWAAGIARALAPASAPTR